MIFGRTEQFAIESKVISIDDSWILGSFQFWIKNRSIGDIHDSTSLGGCYHWLWDFVENPRNRFEPNLMNMNSEKVFFILYDSYMPLGLHYDPENQEPYTDTFDRFSISHLGMSSFDRYDILLIENEVQQRVLWRDSHDLNIFDATLPAGTMQQIAQKFCIWFREQGY